MRDIAPRVHQKASPIGSGTGGLSGLGWGFFSPLGRTERTSTESPAGVETWTVRFRSGTAI
jgi:hypothetical protein